MGFEKNAVIDPVTGKKVAFLVEFSNHDLGSQGGHFMRKTRNDAERSAKLMGECGYKTVTIREWQ